jgi:hypothetical protein
LLESRWNAVCFHKCRSHNKLLLAQGAGAPPLVMMEQEVEDAPAQDRGRKRKHSGNLKDEEGATSEQSTIASRVLAVDAAIEVGQGLADS